MLHDHAKFDEKSSDALAQRAFDVLKKVLGSAEERRRISTLTNIPFPTLKDYLTGRTSPPLERFIAIAVAAGLEPAEFFQNGLVKNKEPVTSAEDISAINGPLYLQHAIAEAIGGRSKASAFAQRTGGLFHPKTLQRWIDGETRPDAIEITALAKATEKPLSYFLPVLDVAAPLPLFPELPPQRADRPDSPADLSPIRECDLYAPSLRLLAEAEDGFLTTSQLAQALTQIFNPQGEDAKILKGRKDSKFTQKVRNMISHRNISTNFIALGYADYIEGPEPGVKITRAGRAFLKTFGVG